MNDEQLRYPIGRFSANPVYSLAEVRSNINRIEIIPGKIKSLLTGYSESHYNTTYRADGWIARQVIHHLADSHLNAYIRIKWALTEETPTIKAYDEKAWAETPETNTDPAISLAFLESLHAKWVILLKHLQQPELERTYYHPDSKKNVPIDQVIATYAWHGEHHLAHLQIIKDKVR